MNNLQDKIKLRKKKEKEIIMHLEFGRRKLKTIFFFKMVFQIEKTKLKDSLVRVR